MARPFSATDDDIIDAAELVMSRDGNEALTLAAVAREVGLTRTAISMRFPSAAALRKIVLDRFVAAFENRVGALTVETGATSLLAIADLVTQMVGGRERLASFVQGLIGKANDPVAMAMEEKRGIILRAVVAKAMPATAVDENAAIDAFMAHLMGSLLSWQARSNLNLRQFMRERTIVWLRLVGIPVDAVTA